MLRTRSVIVAVCMLICLVALSKSIVAKPPEEASAEKPASSASVRKLTKMPEVFGTDVMESTPLVYKGRPLMFHSRRPTVATPGRGETYLLLEDVETGKELTRLGHRHSLGSAFVAGDQINVFAANLTDDWFHDIYRFTTTDLNTWKRELAIPREGNEHLLNSSVCIDPDGYLMAYESDVPVKFCFKFARSKDLATWKKIDGLVFAGAGNEYSACPVIRYFKPYYYVIYLHARIPGHNGYISFMARSKDLATWQLSPKNPILEAGKGEGCNNSDVDLIEIDGKTYVYYATGDQSTWTELKRAVYPGPMVEFFESYFPAGAEMVEVSTRNKPVAETPQQRDARMSWWREARFGMFIHWGLYSVAAGEWKGRPFRRIASWLMDAARIPLDEYTPLVDQFNPVRFDPDQCVRLAKAAGMKYIVITSKHHDGFCLFDSKHTDFDVMSTPFKRDIMKELADACRREGIKLCWYYSILDWHHPDYLPRRAGDERSTTGADFDRYVTYMKNQLHELLTNYGPIGVLWFDGEWDSTWSAKRGKDLYNYLQGLQGDIIINNRVGRDRQDPVAPADRVGDFGTPEQKIPPTGLPGVDWESCMTMNKTWGYKTNDHNWKSTAILIRMLVDCASKGGNFLLNVGPTAEGLIPQPSVDRLEAMGRWMRQNGQSIYGTSASPFPKSLPWGRCTTRQLPDGKTRLYLHVFDWPRDGNLEVPRLRNEVSTAYLLADAKRSPLSASRDDESLKIAVPKVAPDEAVSVVVLDIEGAPDMK